MDGSNMENQAGTYGTQGIPSPANQPGARRDAISWTDLDGDFWLFGGFGYDDAGSLGYLNDLWRFDGTNWTWISGSNLQNQGGTYGTIGVPNPANVPGARRGAIAFLDCRNNIWLSSGQGYDGTNQVGFLNDLWMWDGNQLDMDEW